MWCIVELSAILAAYAFQYSLSLVHLVVVLDELLHRFLPNGDVLVDFDTINLKIDRVNQQDMARRDFVGGKGKSTRGHECSIWVPHVEPGAQRRDTTGNCDLLPDVLTFSRRKIRNNVNLEAG